LPAEASVHGDQPDRSLPFWSKMRARMSALPPPRSRV
jgi:hypothetical protein